MQHLGEIILQLALTLQGFLNLNHGLPDVAEVVAIALRCMLIPSSLELLKL